TIQVLIVERVLIVPDASVWACQLVTQEPDTIVARVGLDLINCRASPSLNGWLLSHGVAHEVKRERLVDASYAALTIRSIVIHVALVRMTLAPGAFVRDDVFGFCKICRPWV